ncbi:YqhG family protein [Paucisalibacillus sp. EB02]|uniref:YqhG family protein n=1 Tax=Paucisalibacillus sp. EB02 TaxID=1347087 RepID=UPI0004BAAF06|nr:YqhG family protein [Paucisalibacillus sp. EB02]
MAINLHSFLENYFEAHHCDILSNQNGVLKVQLNEKMDRALMNRPFYWHYIKKMGRDGDPMQLTLISNQDSLEERGERIHFGSPRLQQILNHLKENERFTRLFQVIQANQNTALQPWLVVNIKISYIGKHKKDEVFSIGLNLINGIMKTEMMESLSDKEFGMKISDFCYTITPIIKPISGYKRILSVLDQYIQDLDHEWAKESLQELENEMNLLKHFYEGAYDEELEQMEKELRDLKERYQPKIQIKVVNGGIFYIRGN